MHNSAINVSHECVFILKTLLLDAFGKEKKNKKHLFKMIPLISSNLHCIKEEHILEFVSLMQFEHNMN